MVTAERRRVRVGAQKPRVLVVPDGKDHPRWREIVEFAGEIGVKLDRWQKLVLRSSLMLQADGKWAASTIGVCAPRQNGKNGILEIRELVGPLFLDERLIVHTSHLSDTSQEAFRRLQDLIEDSPYLKRKVKRVHLRNGFEEIEFHNRGRIRFRTRTAKGGRGFAQASPVVFDEAMYLPEEAIRAAGPIRSTAKNPQVWYTGSAVDQETMPDGVVFTRIRERAMSGNVNRLAYFEWSLDADGPEDVTEEQAASMDSWVATNPAFGIRIMPEYLEDELAELGARGYAVERLGVGDWPDTSPDTGIVDMNTWKILTDENSEIVGPVCLAFDVSPARSNGTICAAGKRGDDLLHVEVVDEREGTGWLVPRLVELCQQHNIASVLCDNRSPAAAMIYDLEARSIDVQAVNSSDYGRACGLFVDVVNEKRLRHLGTSQLRAAIKGAKVRELGDAFAWARKKSAVDITPLVSATLALWGAEALDPGPSSWSFG